MARPRHAPQCTIVIKLGTSSIVHEKTHQPLLSTLSSVVETVVHLRSRGHRVVLVSSGAIGVGLQRMNIPSRPKSLSGKQALAAIGQGRLIALWDDLFGHLEQPIAQVLLTRGDIADRTRYLNAVNTFNELLSMGVVPIVNENDTVSVSEIKFGDNDTLSAITSSMIHADYLFLLTDVDGLYTSNPRKDPDAKQIEAVTSISAIRSQVSTTTLGSSLGTGGMETKIIAAEIATGAGVTTIITSSKHPENIFGIIEYHNSLKTSSTPGTPLEPLSRTSSPVHSPSIPDSHRTGSPHASPLPRPPHTVFKPSSTPMRDLKSWTSHTLYPSGSVIIDTGAHQVLSRRESGGRLLAVGVLGVIGAFASGQAVRIVVLSPAAVQGSLEQSSLASTRPGTLALLAAPETLSRSALFAALTSKPEDEVVPTVKPQFLYDDANVVEVGRGLANYNSAQISKIKGLNSSYIPQLLGYADSEYVVENITIRVPP
ncbi:glutamate 5-kinase [Guyanagaster necrorhizus]|uniref:Glutamate 5-kinase n=1 Tax=Guyanagaster necrorhizus TaxID=856835 RepID=A0A9P8AZB1_9AGAR|nr:glutamate 5-kinase [Guyanagaster necrorhizus MCA 3950]KAG7453096.1 glutamate 5-kinase [Guyanagaster necrorhizus MCA 3950]